MPRLTAITFYHTDTIITVRVDRVHRPGRIFFMLGMPATVAAMLADEVSSQNRHHSRLLPRSRVALMLQRRTFRTFQGVGQANAWVLVLRGLR